MVKIKPTYEELEREINKLKTQIDNQKINQETELKEERIFNLIVNTVPLCIGYVDKNMIYQFNNKTYEKWFGIPAKLLKGKSVRDVIGEKAYQKAEKMFIKVLNGEQINKEETVTFKDGKPRHLSNIFTPDIDKDGNVQGFVTMVYDLTEKKKLEMQLQNSQKMEAIGLLAGGIAHDFNNILMVIEGRTALMLLNTDEPDPHYDHLKSIEDNVKNATELTRQLLNFARGGKHELKPLKLNKVLEEQVYMFCRTKKEITVYKNYEKNLLTIEADIGQIKQIVLNMLINAWQAMPNGGSIYIETKNIILDEDLSSQFQVTPGKFIKFSISDTGIGMNDETRRKIFDPFFTTKKSSHGTGMGLTTSYGIVKNHGGFIDVDSIKDKGTTFSIYLPASKKKTSELKEKTGKIYVGTGLILVIDDEESVVSVAKDMLKELGYSVLTAYKGTDAIKLYSENKRNIDLVILDIIMPEMNGFTIYNKLKKINPDIKVIISSGYSANEKVEELMEQGFTDFIHKPFNLKKLSKKIKAALPL